MCFQLSAYLLQTAQAVHGRQQSLRVCLQTMADRYSGLAFYAGVSSAGLKVRTTDRVVTHQCDTFNSIHLLSQNHIECRRGTRHMNIFTYSVYTNVVVNVTVQTVWMSKACKEQISYILVMKIQFSFF